MLHSLASAAQMRSLDKDAIEHFGVPGVALMENAGRAVAVAVEEELGLLPGRMVASAAVEASKPLFATAERLKRRVAILCGAGNNAGDGFVAARHLRSRGIEASVVLLTPRSKFSGDAKVNLDILQRMAVSCLDLSELDEPSFRMALDSLSRGQFELWVDALLGTGLTGAVRGRLAAAIDFLNSRPEPIVAVDLPSGLHADTGEVCGRAVRASRTLSFGLLKTGQVLGFGPELCGRLERVDIGIPLDAVHSAGLMGELINHGQHPSLRARIALASEGNLSGCFPRRLRQTYKGSYGHVLVLGGAAGKSGAAGMAGLAALRCGAGLVSLGSTAESAPALAAGSWELMVESVCRGERLDELLLSSLLRRCTVLAVGPGLGTAAWAATLLNLLLMGFAGPMVWDADALNLLAEHDKLRSQRPTGPRILTPHLGEAARLLSKSRDHLQADPVGTALALAERFGSVVVLKGASSVVARPDGHFAVNTTGTPAMATAGMGDVLTGLIAGLLAQGLDAWNAAKAGVWLHGWVGEREAQACGERALGPMQMITGLGAALRELEGE
ncbi:MAG: NAD(P)H-hydrate dehydratase [Myxococcota bacterium]|nr:NAD(P)H-hydrate dehydratase [Myxococcota bacterium]